MGKLTKAEKAKVEEKLNWKDGKGYQIDVLGAPLDEKGEPSRTRWKIRVSFTDIFDVIIRQDSKGYFLLDTGKRGKGDRPYIGTTDVNEAIHFAEMYLAGRQATAGAKDEVLAKVETQGEGATFKQLRALFPLTRLADVASADHYDRAVRIGEALFGADTPVSVVGPNSLRRAIEIRYQKGIPSEGLKPCKPVHALGQLKDLVTLIGAVNEIDDEHTPIPQCHLNSGTIKWPEYEKERRAAAKDEGFAFLMLPFKNTLKGGEEVVLPPAVDAVDPTGRLRLFLAIIYYTGRRFSAVLNLWWRHVQTDIWEMRKTLQKADLANRDWAEALPNGLLDFVREWDKENNYFPVPISDMLHAEIELYAARCGGRIGPLFPPEPGVDTVANRQVFSRSPNRARNRDGSWRTYVEVGLYEQAVMLQCRRLEEAGEDPGRFFQVEPLTPEEDRYDLLELDPARFRWTLLKGHKFHRWRSAAATRWEDRGYGAARDAGGNEGAGLTGYPSYIASWVPNDGSVRARRYVDLNPTLLYLCANGVPEWEARPRALGDTIERDRQQEVATANYAAGLTERLTDKQA